MNIQESLDRLAKVKGRRQAVIDSLVEETVGLLQSTLGYFAVMNDAEDVLTMLGWSKSAMGACAVIDKPIVYPIEDTGLWGDAVRERAAVITNDYHNLVKPTKKGYPEGHVRVVRHMNVPVWVGDHIAGVLGVGNKETDYTQEEAEMMVEFARQAWPIVQKAKE